MEKPLILKKVDFVQQLKETVNNSGLPAFLMVETVQALLMELRRLEEQEVQQAISQGDNNNE